MSLSLAPNAEVRRFIATFLLVSTGVLGVGLAGNLVLLQTVEGQLLEEQVKAAQNEADLMARLIDRDLHHGIDPAQTLARLQGAIEGTGSKSDFLCVLDKDGRVLLHPDSTMIGMHEGARPVERMDSGQTVSLANVIGSGDRVTARIHDGEDLDQLAHYRPVESATWTIAVHKNAAVIAGQFSELRWRLLAVAGPTLVLISLVGAGLARTFNHRIERDLAERNAELQRRVEERTAVLRQTLDELQLAHERLLQGEKMHLLGELVAGIAHEINNPLTAISGHAEMLALGHEENPRETGAIISQQTRRVSAIVRNLLDFAHNRPPKRQPGSMHEVLRRAEELMATELRRNGVRFEKDISADLPDVLMDMQQLEQVVINLVRNAAQALAERKSDRRIEVQSFTDGTWVSVLVRDNGPGVPDQFRARVFDSFVTTKADGTGLGLSLCSRFVDSHGGSLDLLPPGPEPGACFRIRLPAMAAAGPRPPTTPPLPS